MARLIAAPPATHPRPRDTAPTERRAEPHTADQPCGQRRHQKPGTRHMHATSISHHQGGVKVSSRTPEKPKRSRPRAIAADYGCRDTKAPDIEMESRCKMGKNPAGLF